MLAIAVFLAAFAVLLLLSILFAGHADSAGPHLSYVHVGNATVLADMELAVQSAGFADSVQGLAPDGPGYPAGPRKWAVVDFAVKNTNLTTAISVPRDSLTFSDRGGDVFFPARPDGLSGEKAFDGMNISPGETRQGLVYFLVPAGIRGTKFGVVNGSGYRVFFEDDDY